MTALVRALALIAAVTIAAFQAARVLAAVIIAVMIIGGHALMFLLCWRLDWTAE